MTTRSIVRSAALTAASLLAAGAAQAVEPGTVQIRARAICIAPDSSSGAVTGVADSRVSVDDAITPEVDVSVYVHEHVSIEVIAATAHHGVHGEGSIAGLGEIVDVGVLPPTVLVQYQFRPEKNVRPYVGGGINYTTFYSEDAAKDLEAALGGPTDVDLDDSWGWALQFGIDFALNEHWFLNFDVKYIDIDTTATLVTDDGFDTRRTVDVDIDPWVPGFGFGYRW